MDLLWEIVFITALAGIGGTGLGLTIARNMALLSNAGLTLINRPEGGLEARLSLPCEEDEAHS